MINSLDIQNAYNELYAQVRKYFWDFSAVDALADLEIACYKACPDLIEVDRAFKRFRPYLHAVISEDDDLAQSVDEFEDIIDVEDSVYIKLNKVNEVVQQ